MNENEMRFEDIEPRSVLVILGNEKYVLTEASGRAMDAYRRAQFGDSTYEDGKAVMRASGLSTADGVLLSQCLFRHKDMKLAPKDFIDSLPNRIRKDLIKRLKEISAIADDEETQEEVDERLKNSPTGTTSGSD